MNSICLAQEKNVVLETKLDSLFKSVFNPNEPGGSMLIAKNNEIIYQRNYGLADIVTKEKITENSVFNTGSISKTFVANGILILKERGLLSLDNSLSHFFDDFDNKSIAEEVKLYHLLSHTSGLPDNRKVQSNRKYYLTAKDKENFEPLKRSKRLNFKSGEKFEYSNPAYNGLALIIEKTTGKKWQTFIDENIFKPSKMNASVITDGAFPDKGVAHAYGLVGGAYVEKDYGEIPTFAAAGNGGVWSTVLDLLKYEQAIKDKVFISSEMTNESRTIYKPENWKDSTIPRVGYGWFITPKEKSRHKVDMIYHTGSQGGFNSFYYYFPDKELLFIGLFNRPLLDAWNQINETMNIISQLDWLD